MISWDGVSVMIDNGVAKAMEYQKQKKTQIWIVAAVIALGVILFIRKH